MKKIIYLAILYFVSCSSNKNIQLIQEKNDTKSLVKIAFYSNKESTIYLRKVFYLKNPYFIFSNVKINYIKEGEYILFAFPTEFSKKHKEYRQFMNDGILHQIKLPPLSNKEITYNVWKDIDTLDFTKSLYKGLESYYLKGKHPLIESSLTDKKIEDKNVIIYEEPYSEFKRKNPELLEFLTKGDTIELEVISPVKQKYRFPAEW